MTISTFTAGVSSARRLQTLLGDLDWIGLDIKGPFSRYDAITARDGSGAAARASVEAVLRSGKPHELRTTVHPELLSSHDLATMLRELTALGARSVTLKNFRPMGCPDPRLATTYRPWLTSQLATELRASRLPGRAQVACPPPNPDMPPRYASAGTVKPVSPTWSGM